MTGVVLLIDDDRDMCDLLEAYLAKAGHTVLSRSSGRAALSTIKSQEPDVVITDLKMPGMSGTELCKEIAVEYPDIPVIVMTAFGSMDSAISAIRVGAYDFVTKPFELGQLSVIVDRALQHKQLTQEVVRLREQVRVRRQFGDLIGESPAMQNVFRVLDRVAPLETTVLLSGETGTGKEVVARAIHRKSARHARPFVAVNCAAVPETLLESELFGHTKGAFTGAGTTHKGLFIQADGGTLFLDEVGEMPLVLQPKLLRALEQRHVRPVGGTAEIPVDVRLIAATNQNLRGAVAQGTFREDLYYRLNVLELSLPPLRDRGNDILVLAQHFLEAIAESTGHASSGFSRAAAERLLTYPWPGNVRELRNCIERALALSEHDKIDVRDLPPAIRQHQSSAVAAGGDDTELIPLEILERRHIERVLASVDGNKTEAARILGVDRRTLYRKLDTYQASDDGEGAT